MKRNRNLEQNGFCVKGDIIEIKVKPQMGDLNLEKYLNIQIICNSTLDNMWKISE